MRWHLGLEGSQEGSVGEGVLGRKTKAKAWK